MKSFIRCVWGDRDLYPEGNLFEKNLRALKNEFTVVMNNPYMKSDEFVVYVLGKKNYEYLKELGLNCVLVGDDPSPFDPVKRIWKHKIFLMEAAMQDFDKIIYMDWDTQPLKELPSNLWDELGKKDSFQAPLFKYASVKMPQRNKKIPSKVLPSGAFIYLSDKTVPTKMLKYESCEWLKNRWLDEAYYGAYTDDVYGRWQSMDFYREHFEPECCNIGRGVFKKKEDAKYFGHPRTRQIG